MIKAVIFDLDDTLISEKQYVLSGYKYVSMILSKNTKINEEVLFESMIELFDISNKNVFNRLLEKFSIDYTEHIIADIVYEYRNHNPIIEFYEDVIPCINLLKQNNVLIGIITDGHLIVQQQKLKALKANNYFNEIIMTDELGKEYWKPHPKPFELMKKKLGIEFNEMVYVGDNPKKDFYIKVIYPINTIRVNRFGFYHNFEYLKGISEDFTVDSLYDLYEIVR